jgi:hypothetical protein
MSMSNPTFVVLFMLSASFQKQWIRLVGAQ